MKKVIHFVSLLFLLLFIPQCSKILKRKRYKDINIYYVSFLPDSVKGITLISDYAVPVDWYLYHPESLNLLNSIDNSGEVVIVVSKFLLNSSVEFRKRLDSLVNVPFLITNSKELQHFVRLNKNGVRISFLNFQKRGDIPVKRATGKYINLMKQTSDVIVGLGDQPEISDNFDFYFEEENSMIRIKLVNDAISEVETEDIENKQKVQQYEVSYQYIEHFLQNHPGTFLLPHNNNSLLAPLVVIDSLSFSSENYKIFGEGSPYYKPFEGEKNVKFFSKEPWLLLIKEDTDE